jgi:hypothetical protein
LGENTNTLRKNTEALLGANRELGLEVNIEKTKYIFVSPYQNAGENHKLLIDNNFFENVSTTVTHQNCIHDEIKSKLRNACYHSVQNF